MWACAAGETDTAIAKRMGLTGMTVCKWSKRYRELGMEVLHDQLRPGLSYLCEDDKMAAVINLALQTRPFDGNTDWSAQTLCCRDRHLKVHPAPLAADSLGVQQLGRETGAIQPG
jgi:transposase